jgi:hypothetical protein
MRSFNDLLTRDEAVNSFEYLLVVGVVVVPFVAALIAGFALIIPEVVGYVCPAVDTAGPGVATVGSCLGF